jgi:hypothetical protein
MKNLFEEFENRSKQLRRSRINFRDFLYYLINECISNTSLYISDNSLDSDIAIEKGSVYYNNKNTDKIVTMDSLFSENIINYIIKSVESDKFSDKLKETSNYFHNFFEDRISIMNDSLSDPNVVYYNEYYILVHKIFEGIKLYKNNNLANSENTNKIPNRDDLIMVYKKQSIDNSDIDNYKIRSFIKNTNLKFRYKIEYYSYLKDKISRDVFSDIIVSSELCNF